MIKRTKYEMCKNFREKGVCKYGDRCLFAHGDHELTRRGSGEPKAAVEEAAQKELLKEAIAVAAIDETTKDSTQLVLSKLEESADVPQIDSLVDDFLADEVPKMSDLKSDSKKPSTGSKDDNAVSSFEIRSDMGVADDEIQDQGENSTTLSSANEHNTPEKLSGKMPPGLNP